MILQIAFDSGCSDLTSQLHFVRIPIPSYPYQCCILAEFFLIVSIVGRKQYFIVLINLFTYE